MNRAIDAEHDLETARAAWDGALPLAVSLRQWAANNHTPPRNPMQPLDLQHTQMDNEWAYEVERRANAIVIALGGEGSLT